MSKKTQKAPPARRTAAARPASGARRTAARPAPAKSRARAASRSPRLNLRNLRIAAVALGVLSVAGFVSLLTTQAAPYTTGVIVELVLLALVAGVCIFTVIRPDLTARSFFQPKK